MLANGDLRLELRVLELPLQKPFRHASHVRTSTRNLFVRAEWRGDDGRELVGLGEGLPRDYVTGETEERGLQVFTELGQEVAGRGVTALTSGFEEVPALRCALHTALLDLEGKARNLPLADLLPAIDPPQREAVQPGHVRYSGVISADDPAKAARKAWMFKLGGFAAVKVKVGVSRDSDLDRVRRTRSILDRWGKRGRVSLRVDANCAWTAAEAIDLLGQMSACDLASVEEPVAAGDHEAAAEVAAATGLPIVLDESFTTLADLEAAARADVPAIANLRLSKLGGLDHACAAAAAARRLGFGLQVGCQVGETGILSAAGRAFLQRAAADARFAEGSFDRYLLRGVRTRPDVTFGFGGRGRWLTSPGIGVEPIDWERFVDPSPATRLQFRASCEWTSPDLCQPGAMVR